MEELRQRISSPTVSFSADLAAWLRPPEKPSPPVSRRHWTGLRNSIAFGVVFFSVISVGTFALTGAAPGTPTAIIAAVLAVVVAIRNWTAESKLAKKEDQIMMEAHHERHRAYLERTEIWSRLVHCARCSLVTDSRTQRSASVYSVHELASAHPEETLIP